MFVFSGCKDFPLTEKEVQKLWEVTRTQVQMPDDQVTMRCVSVQEIQRLNKEYRNKDKPTNILTFSYADEGEHDIALCLEIARVESGEREIPIRDYIALLVVHGLLHVCGMDHEESSESAQAMKEKEQEVLLASGFGAKALSDVY